MLIGTNIITLNLASSMTRLSQTLLSEASAARPLIGHCASRFSPSEIRHAIAELVTNNHSDMARALCEAGLSLYPDSEDIVSISALLAELDQDWQTAQQHLEKLLMLQGSLTQALVWRHLIRVVRCQLDPLKAWKLAQQSVILHPQDSDLQIELSALSEEAAHQTSSQANELAH